MAAAALDGTGDTVSWSRRDDALSQGGYFPEFVEPRRTTEKALTAAIQEARIEGISARSVDDLVNAMGMSGLSKSQVSLSTVTEVSPPGGGDYGITADTRDCAPNSTSG